MAWIPLPVQRGLRWALPLGVALLCGSNADAVLHVTGDGSGNTQSSPPPDDPGIDNVGVAGGLTAVYLGGGWVITADHVGEPPVTLLGVTYPAVPGSKTQLEHGIEVRRYEAGTDPSAGAVIAELQDRLCRFVTVGDIEGDGQLEMVIASFSSGVWLARPGDDPNAAWALSSVDRDSGGFEHAALLSDLDGDGKDELYVASDKHKELRRYVWDGRRLQRETITARTDGMSIFTWNIMPIPRTLVPR